MANSLEMVGTEVEGGGGGRGSFMPLLVVCIYILSSRFPLCSVTFNHQNLIFRATGSIRQSNNDRSC